jgi:hypothetical protein
MNTVYMREMQRIVRYRVAVQAFTVRTVCRFIPDFGVNLGQRSHLFSNSVDFVGDEISWTTWLLRLLASSVP